MEFPVAALSPVYENVLADVTAYVEVWSSSRRENYSKTFSQQLLNLGAKVSKTFNKHVTHVIFKDGHQGTWDKAVKAGVKLVSVLWVEKCREAAAHIDESGFPAINTNDGLPQIVKKKHKCMQPKDFVEKTPENDRRMQRKFDEMSKALKVQKAAVDDPVLLFDEYGTLMYSPKAVAADRCNAMEKRIKEMKNKRENLSPTASQISQPFDFLPIKPSIGYSPSALNSPIDNGSADLDTSYDELWGSLEKKETISNGWKNKATSKKTVIGATELEDPNCQINSINSSINLTPPQSKDKKNNHAIPSFQKKTRKSLAKSKNVENPGESVMNCGTPSAVYSSVDYAALTNKFTVKCEENVRTRKARSSSLKSKTPASNKKTVVPEIPKFSDVTTAGDSEGTCSSFEDFFSVDMKSQKRPFTRFSLGTLPPKSPTSPLLVINKKGSSRKRRRSEQNLGELNSSSGKRRRKSISKKDILVDSEAAEFESLHDAKTMPTVGDCIGSNPMDASKNKTVRSDQVNNNGTTSISLSTSTTNVNIKDKLIMSSEITQKEDTCLVKGMEKIAELMACKQSPNQTVMKNCTGCEKQEEEPKRFKKYAESKYPASNGLSKFLNEQRNKCNDNEELKKKEKIRKISGSLVMTSMCSEKQNTVIQVVKKFGGFVFSDHVCETTTHVIAGSPRRTLNIILGIARGCWIISYDWVLWSLECGHWISEEPYELSDHFPGAPIGRLQRHLSAGEYQQDLLSSLPAVFISPSSQPPCDKLSEVVQLCGGKVCKALRQAKICIGKFNGKRAPDVQNVSEKWLLDSITQHRLHPLENYLLDQ